MIRALTLTFALLLSTSVSHAATAFIDVSVIPMTSETILDHQTVLVDKNRIQAIGPVDKVRVPRKAEKVDGTGKFLIPGLFDMHAHFFAGKRGNPQVLRMYAKYGVTTVLNMSGNKGVLQLRSAVANGEEVGPRIFTTSPIQGNFTPTPDTYEKGYAAIERYAAAGYDYIKVYNYIPELGYNGIRDAAKKHGIPLIGHAVRSIGIEGALANGQHIAHMEEYNYGYFQDGLDESRIPELVAKVKKAGIYTVATLVAYDHIIRQVDDIDSMIASPGFDLLPKGMTKSWLPENNDYLKRFDQESADKYLRPSYAFLFKLTKAFQDADIPILLGTDACIPIVIPGYSAHEELIELQRAGLSPYQALVAGTRTPAEFLGIADDVGTIQRGKQADLILLNANPFQDLSQTLNQAGVMLHGKWYDRTALDNLVPTPE